MKKNIIRIVSLVLLMVTVLSIMTIAVPIPAEAATTSNSVKSVKVNTSDDSWYKATKDTKLRTGTGLFADTFATIKSGTYFQISSTGSKYHTVKLDGVKYYILKKDFGNIKEADSTCSSDLYYVKSDSALLRKSPHNKASSSNISAGKVLMIIGRVVHKSNDWLVVYDNGNVRFIYKPHCTKTNKITLEITGDSSAVDVGKELTLKYKVSPSGVSGVRWSSDNPNVAKVTNGRVSGVGIGRTTIKATIDGVISVSYSIEVGISLNVKAYRQTTNYTCSAAAALAVLRYKGKAANVNDVTLYRKTQGVVYRIANTLNEYLGKGTYTYKTFTNFDKYEQAILGSLKQGCPVIARVRFAKGYFNYSSSGHYVTIVAMYKDDNGTTWVKMVDSFAHLHKSNAYTDANTGIVRVPLRTLYEYNLYNPGRYLIYNN